MRARLSPQSVEFFLFQEFLHALSELSKSLDNMSVPFQKTLCLYIFPYPGANFMHLLQSFFGLGRVVDQGVLAHRNVTKHTNGDFENQPL